MFKLQLALIGKIGLQLKNSGLLLIKIKEINKPHHNSLYTLNLCCKRMIILKTAPPEQQLHNGENIELFSYSWASFLLYCKSIVRRLAAN
jgi:hypothetical protein